MIRDSGEEKFIHNARLQDNRQAASTMMTSSEAEVLRQAPDPAWRFADGARSFLVTGATGFIGQRLVRALLRDGHRVTVLTRQPRQAAWMFDGRVECVASMAQLPATRRAVLRQSRIGLTGQLAAWISAAQHKPAMLLSASAIGYYGVQPRGDATVLTEQHGPQPILMSELCQEWEAAARAVEADGVKVACMRFGLVLGTQGALPMMLLPVKLGLGGPLGGGAQWLSWIHVDDLIGAMAHLYRTGGSGSYNFTAPETLTQAQFNRVAASVLHRPYGMPTPGWPMRLALGEQADLLLEGQRVAPARLLDSGFVFTYPELRPALRNLL